MRTFSTLAILAVMLLFSVTFSNASGTFNGVIKAQVENGNILNSKIKKFGIVDRIRDTDTWDTIPLSGTYANGKIRPIQMFFQNVSQTRDIYIIDGKSKTNAAEDTFRGTLTISEETKGGSCKSGETELKGSYDLTEKKSKTSGSFKGTFTACEKSGKLTKASFKGDWVKHSTGSKTPCNFEL